MANSNERFEAMTAVVKARNALYLAIHGGCTWKLGSDMVLAEEALNDLDEFMPMINDEFLRHKPEMRNEVRT